MYVLFLECEAAKQIDRYCAGDPEFDAEDIKRRCYLNARNNPSASYLWEDQESFDNWWVARCLDDDSHKTLTIDSLMTWAMTPEGHRFWENINDPIQDLF